MPELDTAKHPVHFVNKEGQKSPSAFIPFCEFGGNMSQMGINIDEFDVPVCNSFQAKRLNDQLCYEVDLNRFTNRDNIKNELELGFVFIMDYNEDRQVTFKEAKKAVSLSLVKSIDKSNENQHAFIYLNTIGNITYIKYTSELKIVIIRACETYWGRKV